MKSSILIVSMFLLSAGLALGGENQSDTASSLAGVRSTDAAVVSRSIDNLRSHGPSGLGAILQEYDRQPDPKLIPVIDAIAGQRGATVSRLFWYTDLPAAEAAAKIERKPILYLRLMGKLTDEYSCANSRFFRTVLYSNRQVSGLLRDRFVLVWTSERPVPVITIDYGDGRILKRTITGNSIHYVLDANGQVFDALPGLFDPVTFARIITQAGAVAIGHGNRDWYLQRADDTILRQWKQDADKVNPRLITVDADVQKAADKADAASAMRMTVSKMAVETPMLRAMSPDFAAVLDVAIDSTDEASWAQIAGLHEGDAKLDEQSVAVIRDQNPGAYTDPAALDQTVHHFEQTIAQDSVRDNYKLRRQVLAWLRQASSEITVDDLNRRVYDDLFLTPRSDPWLGLAPVGVYSALTCDGICAASPN
jgi:hypothetical protein